MLFSKDIPARCIWCKNGEAMDDGRVICRFHGPVPGENAANMPMTPTSASLRQKQDPKCPLFPSLWRTMETEFEDFRIFSLDIAQKSCIIVGCILAPATGRSRQRRKAVQRP